MAEVKVAGPHAVERLVLGGSRAGGSLDIHAAAVGWCWSVVVGPKRGAQSRVAVRRGPAERLLRPRFATWRLVCLGVRRLGPLPDAGAPLEAGERVIMGAAAAFSAWPPALRESVAYLLSVLAVLLRHAAS